MIVFQQNDKKIEHLINALSSIRIKAKGVSSSMILTPFFTIKMILRGEKPEVYVFRYINDRKSFFFTFLRYFSEILQILICKKFNIKIWWLCHNIDKETKLYHPTINKLRRKAVKKAAIRIFTTNRLLIPKAKEVFPNKRVDALSFGYMEGKFSESIAENDETDKEIISWINQRKNDKSKFIFCVGSPAKKSIHFKHITKFIEVINSNSDYNWYAIVIGNSVQKTTMLYNVSHRHFLPSTIISKYADYYYRIIDDYSISYSVFEAVHYRVPIITESYGILPTIVEQYNIGIVVDNYKVAEKHIINHNITESNFIEFEKENNWKTAANKIKECYEIDVK